MQLTVDGLSTYVYTAGKKLNPDLPAVVFIHGAELDHSCWTLQSRWCAHHGYATLAVDLPGHGRSAGPALASIVAMANWIVALLDAAGLARAALVGHSMGSLIALETAASHAQRVSALALLGHASPMPVSDMLLAAAKNDEALAQQMVNIWSHSARGHVGGNTAPGLWLLGMNQRLMERSDPGLLHNDLSACNDYRQGLAQAARVTSPALLLCGSGDLMTPAKATLDIAKALPRMQRVVLPGAGHAMMAEQPDAVLDALIAFLAPLKAQAPAATPA